MNAILQLGLSNTLVATFLAVLAACVGRFCRRPALVHTLWLLVLLKLVTPSPLVLPVSVPLVQIASSESSLSADLVLADAMSDSQKPWSETFRNLTWAVACWLRDSWGKLLMTIWLTGSALWFTLVGIRSYRFTRLLRFGRPVPWTLQAQAESLASDFGLGHCPNLRLLPGVLSPMLWGLGRRSWLLLPVDLVNRLDAEELRTLLAHELAHARRRDPYVRILELAALCLYWWLPVTWWARRRLREAEEQCCDAWVVWTLPSSAPSYAKALVETVAFLSAGRPALPPAATGIGYVRVLEKRLNLILLGTPPRQISILGLLAVVGVGSLLLPLRPVVGQDEQPKKVELNVADDQNQVNAQPDTRFVAARPEAKRLVAPDPVPTMLAPGKKEPKKEPPSEPRRPGAGKGPPPGERGEFGPPPGGKGGKGPPGGGKGPPGAGKGPPAPGGGKGPAAKKGPGGRGGPGGGRPKGPPPPELSSLFGNAFDRSEQFGVPFFDGRRAFALKEVCI